ncbi:carboxylesterase/lipase family protein [Brevundimonas sp. NPDC092305]|uniref:carboxylesterase/lipase family protein n=1 Tax=Brevundimonas sp. NPDC092305 TaxID=3363957 RepID=UPI0037F5A187
MHRALLLILSLIALAGCATHPGKVGHVRSVADRAAVVAETASGPVRGMEGAGVRAFLGVPYAAPPVGELRWRAPRPPEPWTEPRDATRIGADCTQAIGRKAILGGGGGLVFGKEDCLYVNVYAPAGAEGPLPVMVFLPGGAFTIGSGANYDPSRLVGRGRVLVTVNYRLGALGWLAHEDFAADGEGIGGNWGLMDQQAALRWVQDNIAAFGGDPADVTVFAESAGAWSLCSLMTSPGSEGLWSRVILQSGTCVEPTSLWSAGEAAESGNTFAASVGCTDEDVRACLRRTPASRLAKAASRRQGLNGPGSWGPVYGDAVVPMAPPEAFARGAFVKTPVMIGSNADEGRLFAVEVRDGERYDKETVWMYGEEIGSRVLERYPVEDEAWGLTMARQFTDQKFACPADALRRMLARHVPVWGYQFADPDAPIVIPRWLTPYDMGAYHASELTYVFGTRWAFADPARFTPEQKALSERMGDLWAGFGSEGFEVNWPRMAADGGAVRVFSPEGDRVDDGFSDRHECGFWATTVFGPVGG